MLSKHEEQAERNEYLENEKRLRERKGSTYLAHTHNDVGGRFAAISSPQVIAATGAPKYEGAPNWAPDPTGPEPSFGVDINRVEPNG